MGYRLGKHSLQQLEGVHPQLVGVVREAILLTGQDFTVHTGLRSRAEQRRLVEKGVSQTMNSKHLKQPDGYGHAVDLVPYIDGRLRWEWEPIFVIAQAVATTAKRFEVGIRWGGCWSRIDCVDVTPKRLMYSYIDKRRTEGRRAFCDGPHFELAR